MQKVVQELQAEQSLPARNPFDTLAAMSWISRYEMILAAQALSPADPFATIVTQHSTVVANAITNHNKKGA